MVTRLYAINDVLNRGAGKVVPEGGVHAEVAGDVGGLATNPVIPEHFGELCLLHPSKAYSFELSELSGRL